MKTSEKKKRPKRLKFGTSLSRLVKKHLKDDQTVASTALQILEDEAGYLVQKIVDAAQKAQTGVFQTQTLSAQVLKGGIALALPEEAAEKATEAGEAAVEKLLASRSVAGASGS